MGEGQGCHGSLTIQDVDRTSVPSFLNHLSDRWVCDAVTTAKPLHLIDDLPHGLLLSDIRRLQCRQGNPVFGDRYPLPFGDTFQESGKMSFCFVNAYGFQNQILSMREEGMGKRCLFKVGVVEALVLDR